MDPLTSFSGLSSGIDTKKLVDAIIAQERAPAARDEATVSKVQDQLDQWGKYRTLVGALNTAATKLKDGSGLGALAATVTGTTSAGSPLFSATTGLLAKPGDYEVEVVQRARAGVARSQATVTDPGAALGFTGTFTVNGQTVTVAAGDSLNAVRDAINALDTGTSPTKVRASVISTDGTHYALVLKASTTGAASLTLADGSPDGVLGAGELDLLTTAGQDAKIRVDGVDVTRSSNTITDAIPGVTLNLLAEEQGTTATLRIAADPKAARDAMQAFVDAYNGIVDYMKGQQAQPVNGVQAPLYGDTLLRSTRFSLSNTVLARVTSVGVDTQTLAAVGVSLTSEGRMTFNAAKFDDAYAAHRDDVTAMAADRGAAFASLADDLVRVGTGSIATRETQLRARIDSLNERIARVDARLAQRRSQLNLQFARMESALSRLQGQSTGSLSQLSTLKG